MLSAMMWRSRGGVAVEDRDMRNDCGWHDGRDGRRRSRSRSPSRRAKTPPSMRAQKKEFFMLSRELREAADQPNRHRQRRTYDLADIVFELTRWARAVGLAREPGWPPPLLVGGLCWWCVL